jgi:hypothetical protein
MEAPGSRAGWRTITPVWWGIKRTGGGTGNGYNGHGKRKTQIAKSKTQGGGAATKNDLAVQPDGDQIAVDPLSFSFITFPIFPSPAASPDRKEKTGK